MNSTNLNALVLQSMDRRSMHFSGDRAVDFDLKGVVDGLDD